MGHARLTKRLPTRFTVIRRLKRCAVLFCLGALFGPIGDSFHVLTHTLTYPQNRFRLYWLGMPYWTPILFGAATLVIGCAHLIAERILRVKRERLNRRRSV